MRGQIRIEPGPHGPGFDQVLRAAAEATLQDLGIEAANLTVVLVDEAEMARLNAHFAGEHQPTDVLSFPDGELDPDSGLPYLGEVFVCPPVAYGSAARDRHSLLDEMALLTVHGVLHLLNFDHDADAQRTRMWEAQARILRRLGRRIRLP